MFEAVPEGVKLADLVAAYNNGHVEKDLKVRGEHEQCGPWTELHFLRVPERNPREIWLCFDSKAWRCLCHLSLMWGRSTLLLPPEKTKTMHEIIFKRITEHGEWNMNLMHALLPRVIIFITASFDIWFSYPVIVLKLCSDHRPQYIFLVRPPMLL